MNTSDKSNLQGEGDYDASRNYRNRIETFLKTNDVAEVARAAAPKSKSDAQEMKAAEAKGRARAKLKVPAKRTS